MTNDDSYKMMDAMRRHMGLNVYETDKTLEPMMVKCINFAIVLRRRKMILKVLKENEDGSVDVQLDEISPEMHQLILQTGFIKLLQDAMDKAEKEDKLPALFKKAE
jgi:sugar-specific transcriptional regulator TrmB